MRVVIDIEANGLRSPDKIWVVVCKDIDTGEYYIFREITENEEELKNFKTFVTRVDLWIGHNILDYDGPVLSVLCGIHDCYDPDKVRDTFILSKLIDYSRKGHSIEDYGYEFNYPKGFQIETGEIIEARHFPTGFYSKYSIDLENYCKRDVDITHKIFLKYKYYLSNPSVKTEHRFKLITNELSNNGFYFNKDKATKLLTKVTEELSILDNNIALSFRPKLKLVREVVPKLTKYGTISLTSIPKILRKNIHEYTAEAPFCYCEWSRFNPASHKQIVAVLNQAGWKPTDKTKAHIEAERTAQKSKSHAAREDLETYRSTGWKVNETNLETLPSSAPHGARVLARRILLESRRRTLTEWLDLLSPDQRIHGRFYPIGAWTHRMAHQAPNTANIPNEFDTQGKRKLLGKELRSLWRAPKDRLLVGCDAEGIQLRIFAHYIDDPQFTESLVNGRKEDRTDPHSLNQSILGPVCKSRAAAKRYIYALLLGAGNGKLREILDCNPDDATKAFSKLLERYAGLQYLKETVIPRDAKRGWFVGLDGRHVKIPGDKTGERAHLAMSGYLQNGEAVVMKLATLEWVALLRNYDAKLVNLVHDEWQVECPNDMKIALAIAEMMSKSLFTVGCGLKLKCPLTGSYWNDDLKDYTIGTNWSVTH